MCPIFCIWVCILVLVFIRVLDKIQNNVNVPYLKVKKDIILSIFQVSSILARTLINQN